MTETTNTPTPQSQVGAILAKSAPVEEKPLDLSKLVFKSMPKGYPVPKNYTSPQAAAAAPSFTPQVEASAAQTAVQPAMVGSKSHRGLWIGLIILILLAAGGGAYFFLILKHANSTKSVLTQPTTTPPVTSPTTTEPPNGGTPPTNIPSSSTTPPVSTTTIDPAWLTQYFPAYVVNGVCPPANQAICGNSADPDADGLTNLQEFIAKTDPTNPDTDGDGIADGDEVNIFGTDPLNAHTSGDLQHSDSGDIKYKYNSAAKANFTDADLTRIAAAIKEYGLHSPTTQTLPQDIIEFYTNYQSSTPAPSGTPASTTVPVVTPPASTTAQ